MQHDLNTTRLRLFQKAHVALLRNKSYSRWHRYHHAEAIHFSTAIFSVMVIASLFVSLLLPTATKAAPLTKTWSSQTDWSGWNTTNLSISDIPGSVTLAKQSADWATISSPTSNQITTSWGLSATDIWAAGDSGTLLHYNGTSWTTQTSPTAAGIHTIWASSSSDVWLGTNDGKIYHYDGSNWSLSYSDVNILEVHTISGTGSSDVWAAAYSSSIEAELFLHFDGSSWTQHTTNATIGPAYAIWTRATNDIWAVGYTGSISHYDGSNWTSEVGIITAEHLYGVWGSSANDIWAAGGAGTLLHYDGANWNTVTQSTAANLREIWGSSASDIWLIGDNGTTLHYNGTNWSAVTNATSNALNTIWGSSASDIWASGASGTIVHYYQQYQSTGVMTYVYTPSAGQVQDWQTTNVSRTTNGQTVTASFSTDTACTSGFVSNITLLANAESICLKLNLSTSDTAVTPSVESVTLTYETVVAPEPTDDPSPSPIIAAISAAPDPSPSATTSPSPSPSPTVKATPTPTVTPTSTTDIVAAVTTEPMQIPSPVASPTPTAIASPEPPTELVAPRVLGATTEVFITATVVAAAGQFVVSAVQSAASLPNFISNVWLHIISLGNRKRRRPWGVVKDSATGQPIDQAIVTLFVSENGQDKVIEKSYTDETGRFGFLARTGTYKIIVQKPGYTFPSQELTRSYQGASFTVANDKTLTMEIYLDHAMNKSSWLVFWRKLVVLLDWVRLPLLLIGTIIAIYTYVRYPVTLHAVFLTIYVFVWLLELLNLSKSRNTLSVVDENNRPLPFTLIRFTSKKDPRLSINKVTDKEGELYILAPAGPYLVIVPSPRNPEGAAQELNLPRGVVPGHKKLKVHY